MTAIFVALLIVAAMAGLGWPLARRLADDLDPAERLGLAPLLGALPLAVLIQAVGYWRYDFGAMAALLVPGLGAAWFFPWRRLVGRPSLTVWSGLIVVVMAGLVLSALAPPIDHDSIRYHLTLPRRDMELGQIRAWFGWSIYEFFPPLSALLTRMAYALGGAEAAQMLNVAWVGLASVWAGLLVRRLGGQGNAPVVAALLFMGQRVVLNLGPAVTTDIPLAAFVGAATCVALAGRFGLTSRLAILLGLLLGAAMGCKSHGMIIGLAVLAILALWRFSQPRHWGAVIGAGLVSLAVIAPVLLRNAVVTGNPFFPNAHQLFGADNLDIFAPFTRALAERTHIPGGLLALPWTMFIFQDSFDGLQFGYPFMLLGLPFAFLRQRVARLFVLAPVGLYVLAWWFAMPPLLRFLQPVFVPLVALTALGLVEGSTALSRQSGLRWAVRAIMALCVALQALFAGSSLLYRLPVVLGQKSLVEALEVPAFRYYSLIRPCQWLDRHLQAGETYLPMVNDPSFYCPQAAALHPLGADEAAAFYTLSGLPTLSAQQVARLLHDNKVRYILRALNLGADDERYAFAKHRFDTVIGPVLGKMTPLLDSPSGKIYAAEPVIAALEQASARPPHPANP
ncbi:MAG: glycosyltransferase family 39 protein [Magnetospirillum sp.]